jgi:hypothetical protein
VLRADQFARAIFLGEAIPALLPEGGDTALRVDDISDAIQGVEDGLGRKATDDCTL